MVDFAERLKQKKAYVQGELDKIEGREKITDRVTGREKITDRVTGREQITDRVTGVAGKEIPQVDFAKRLEQRKSQTVPEPAPIPTDVQKNIPVDYQEDQGFLGALKPTAEKIHEAFTGEKRHTQKTRTLPEFRELELKDLKTYGRGRYQQLKLTAGLLSTFNEQGQMEIIKEAIPEAVFSQDSKGNIIVRTPKGESVLNKPGLSGQDAIRFIAQSIAQIAPTKVAQIGKTVLSKFLMGGAAAGGVEATRQAISRGAGSKQPFDPLAVGIETGLGGVSEIGGPIVKNIQARRLGLDVEDIAPAAKSIAVGETAAKKTGIPLFKAQKTIVPSQLERQSFIAQLPAGSQEAMKKLTIQNKKAAESVGNFLENIASPESIISGSEKFRSAARKAVAAQKRIREEAASPHYIEAFKNKDFVNIDIVKKFVDKTIEDYPSGGEVSKSFKKIKQMISGEQDLKKLHNVKLEIDQMLEKFGDNSLGNTTKLEVLEAQNALLKRMDNFSNDYKDARKIYASESITVDALKDSIIGKVAAYDDINLKKISRNVFDPAETNPSVILQAKKVINKADPEAWGQRVRVELERRLGNFENLLDDIDVGGVFAVENVPRQLKKAIFGNYKQTKILYNSLDGEAKKNLKYLETALKRASLGRPGGSQTGIRSELSKEFDKGITLGILNFIGSPIESLKQGVKTIQGDIERNRKIRATAESIFDLRYQKDMAKIRKLAPNSKEAETAYGKLLNRIYEEIKTSVKPGRIATRLAPHSLLKNNKAMAEEK